ncbi:MAG: IclR family transcriptional regulator [Spirosoma sp.]|nr:IclR family transcriptional regulator [Spirosoma sp.]
MVQVIVRGFDILELIARQEGQAATLTEISERLALNQSTSANIIKTLVFKGYLEHIGTKKGYRLGPAAFKLTNEVPYGQDLVRASQAIMEALTARLRESCVLGVLRNNKRYTLLAVNSEQDVQVQIHSERNVYDTASGRLLLAYLSPNELRKFIDQNGLPSEIMWPDAVKAELLIKQLDSIRREEIVFTNHKDRHVKGFAVPVFAKRTVVAGLSVFLPEYRCTSGKQAEIITALREAANQISVRLT